MTEWGTPERHREDLLCVARHFLVNHADKDCVDCKAGAFLVMAVEREMAGASDHSQQHLPLEVK